MLCDIGYVIRDHIPALMQLLTNELTQYRMELLTTKCLNTAVMVWYLFLGEREDTFNDASVCDSRSVQAKGKMTRKEFERMNKPFIESELHPLNVATAFRDELLYTGETKKNSGNTPTNDSIDGHQVRSIFYVILTDAEMPEASREGKKCDEDDYDEDNDDFRNCKKRSVKNAPSKRAPREPREPLKALQHFPGHVFVVEKVTYCDKRNRYNLYQSYINNYTLDGHVKFNRSLGMSQERAEKLAEGIRAMYSKPCWDKKDSAFWKRFAHVDVSRYEGYQFSDQSYMCFRKANTTNCVSHLRNFVRQKLSDLETGLKAGEINERDIYGDESLYTGSQRGVDIQILTNEEMCEELHSLLGKL